ncbi:MAG TPA: OsmC family protein [Candidatus Cybelea sp.]|nr:OsmC family protein [Candidatus Cybelea sp.]
MKTHRYRTLLEWSAPGEGTTSYRSYSRDFTIASPNKEPIAGSSDPAFRGNPRRYNPEEMLVASLSACHMLWYLHLCSINGIAVLAYRDEAGGTMRENPDGSGEFERVELRPAVTIAPGGDGARALALHEEAHRLCFIARSVNFPVAVDGEITLACRIPELET